MPRGAGHEVDRSVALCESTANKQRRTAGPVFRRINPSVFGSDEWYKWLHEKLTVVCFGAKIVAAWVGLKPQFRCSPLSEDPTNTGLYVQASAFPYLFVTKSSIRPPCLNFTIYMSPVLPRRLNVLLPTHTHRPTYTHPHTHIHLQTHTHTLNLHTHTHTHTYAIVTHSFTHAQPPLLGSEVGNQDLQDADER